MVLQQPDKVNYKLQTSFSSKKTPFTCSEYVDYDVFGSKPEGGESGSKFQGPTLSTQASCDTGTVWENPSTQVEKVTVTLVKPGIWVHQSKFQGTADGPMEHAAGEAKRRETPRSLTPGDDPAMVGWGWLVDLGGGVSRGVT